MMLVFRHFEIFNTTALQAVRDLTVRRMVVHLEHAESVSFDLLWETVLSRVECFGGLTLEMSCKSERDEEELLRRRWSSRGEAGQQFGEWQLRYTIPRADGLFVSFFASGHQIPREKRQSLDQLTHIFEACGRHLPGIEELRQLDATTRIHSPSSDASQVITDQETTVQRRAA
jgi:hypothetical protein